MNTFYYTAAILTLILGIIHSLVGEQYFLRKLFRRELPFYVGSEVFVNQSTRISWHLTTLAWWGFTWILFQVSDLAYQEIGDSIAIVITIIFIGSAVLTAAISRGRYFVWIAYLLIALTTGLGIFFG